MNVSRIYLITILSVAFGISAKGQYAPKAILVDAFEEIPCGDLLGRTDAFFSELMRHPADLGYVNIPASRKKPAVTKLFIRSNAYMRRFDASRLRIVINSEAPTNIAQFWRVPAGADFPKFSDVPDELRDFSKPFIFGRADENGVCPSFIPDDFIELVKSNPGSHGRMVVLGNTRIARKSLAENFLTDLLSKQGLTKDRLRVNYVYRSKHLAEVEFWFIPAKQK